MTANGPGAGDFEALARHYWTTWGDALAHKAAHPDSAAPNSAAGAPAGGGEQVDAGWKQAFALWSRLLPRDTTPEAQDALERFRNQAGDWLGTMQEVAARFAGRDSSSEDVAQAWREAVEGQGERLMQWTLGSLRGGAVGGSDPWLQEVARLLAQWQGEAAPWLDLPAFGAGRNHQARWQGLARAQQDYQAQAQAYGEQLKVALERAFTVFQAKLAEHEGAGAQLTSARAMFDVWIEAAEEAYSAIALSEEFRRVYGAFANAQMRLRAAVQQEVEQIGERLGMPTRSEMDAAHRRIAELERLVRRMASAREPRQAPARSAPAPQPAAAAPRPATASPAKPGAAAKPAAAVRKAAATTRPAAARAPGKPAAPPRKARKAP